MPLQSRPTPSAPPSKTSDIDTSWLAIVQNWRIVVAELMERGVDLYDAAVLARPWPGVRTLIFSLLETSPRLRAALRREPDADVRPRA